MRSNSQLLFSLLVLGVPAIVGCFGDGPIFGGGPADTHLQDNYGSGGTPVRGSYALGAEVQFSPDLADEDVGAPTNIMLMGSGLVETSRAGNTVTALAMEEGSGEVTFFLRGVEEERIPYDVLAADTLEFRRVFDVFGREDISFELVLAQGDTQAEIVIDYFAGARRLFGHRIATAGEGGTVSPTSNNDRLRLDTSVVGARRVELSLVGGSTGAFDFTVVDSIANIELTQSTSGDSVRIDGTATDAMGRTVRSPIEWLVDGERVDGASNFVALRPGAVTRTVTARLLDAEATTTAMLE